MGEFYTGSILLSEPQYRDPYCGHLATSPHMPELRRLRTHSIPHKTVLTTAHLRTLQASSLCKWELPPIFKNGAYEERSAHPCHLTARTMNPERAYNLSLSIQTSSDHGKRDPQNARPLHRPFSARPSQPTVPTYELPVWNSFSMQRDRVFMRQPPCALVLLLDNLELQQPRGDADADECFRPSPCLHFLAIGTLCHEAATPHDKSQALLADCIPKTNKDQYFETHLNK